MENPKNISPSFIQQVNTIRISRMIENSNSSLLNLYVDESKIKKVFKFQNYGNIFKDVRSRLNNGKKKNSKASINNKNEKKSFFTNFSWCNKYPYSVDNFLKDKQNGI